jgi:bifunctional non-homologous end joining protein LigD
MAKSTKTTVEVDGKQLNLSNLDKVLYPDSGFTKAEVLDYYLRIAPVLLPHICDRPLTMRRFPDGVAGESFYEKHLPRGTPEWVRRCRLPASPNTRNPAGVEFAVIDDRPSLAWAANLASLELHVPQWKIGPDNRPSPPDLMVFDLDPGEPATSVECARVALILAEELERTKGWTTYPKTSGSKGLQLYARLGEGERPDTWEVGETREEAKRLAARLAKEHPDEIVSIMKKEIRGGKVLIDWSQNHVAKTTVAPYSLRARPEPTVSTPLTWEEVEHCAKGGKGAAEGLRFLPAQVLERVDDLGDLLAPLETHGR